MNSDFIRNYIKYKIKCLSEYASFFFQGYDQNLIDTCLRSYFETYTNTYFYHVLGTLDSANDFSLGTIKIELNGIKEEILDEYKDLEFIVENAEYMKNRNAIIEMVDVCLFICQLDWLRYKDKEMIVSEVNQFLNKFPVMKERLGTNCNRLISKIKENFTLEHKVFNDDKAFFKVDYTRELKKDVLYLTKLVHSIKILQTNYKKSMVERIFTDDRFTIEKTKTMFWKLPRELMRKFLAGEKIGKYIVIIDDKMFQRGNIDLFRMIDNPFLKRYLVLAVSFNSYQYHRDFLEYLGFEVACNQDLSHVGEVLDKLNSIDSEKFFNYILINDYKYNDKETILGYECNPGLELYITKEE